MSQPGKTTNKVAKSAHDDKTGRNLIKKKRHERIVGAHPAVFRLSGTRRRRPRAPQNNPNLIARIKMENERDTDNREKTKSNFS